MTSHAGGMKTLGLAFVLALTGSALGQGFGGGGGGFNPAQLRQAILGRIQGQVGFTDDEWTVVEPRLWRIVGLQAQTGSGQIGSAAGMMRRLGRGRGGGGGPGAVPAGGMNFDPNAIMSQIFNDGKPIPALEAEQGLEALLDDPNSSTDQIEIKLREYRDAVKKAKTELAAAQKDLQNLLTVRQEAILVQMGLID